MGMFPRVTRRRLAWAGLASAVGTAGYMLYKLYSEQEEPEEQTDCVDIALGRTALEDGLSSLDASCKAFEVSLQRAVQRGDTSTANRLRSVLRRAYATMETLNTSFGIGKAGAAERLSLAGPATLLPAGEPRDEDHDDLDDGASTQDWYDAQERLAHTDQDVGGFDSPVQGKMLHVADIPAQPRGVDIWAEALALARAGKIKVRLDRSKYTGSTNKIDFLARVHCFREATSLIGRSVSDKNFIRDSFMKVVTGILVQDDQDPSGWVNTVDACVRFTEAEVARDGGAKVLKELQTKQLGPPVVAINPYDLLFDYALFEVFDMVTNPPKAVMNALQSSWMPTAVRNRGIRSLSWTMVRAIRALTPSNTFHSHFYALVHQALPSFTMGLLGIGTPGHNDLCRGTQMLLMQCTKDCFQIPGSVPHLTTELYAKKMLEVARAYTPRAIQMVARAVKDD